MSNFQVNVDGVGDCHRLRGRWRNALDVQAAGEEEGVVEQVVERAGRGSGEREHGRGSTGGESGKWSGRRTGSRDVGGCRVALLFNVISVFSFEFCTFLSVSGYFLIK